MHRFFADKSHISSGYVHLDGDDVKHITKVLRLHEGDRISVCDMNKTDYICKITSLGKDFVDALIEEEIPNQNESNLCITLYQGVPKGDKLDYIIQKCVELGVCRIVPVVMDRTIVKKTNIAPKLQRWQRISYEASKQCMRGIIPKVEEPINFLDIFANIDINSLTILPYENESQTKLKDVLKNNTSYEQINIIIGPEGGFAKEEVELALSNNAKVVTLGPRIMRCETAPLACVSAIMYELGDW